LIYSWTQITNTFNCNPCWVNPQLLLAGHASGQSLWFSAHTPLADIFCWYAHPLSVNTCSWSVVFIVLSFDMPLSDALFIFSLCCYSYVVVVFVDSPTSSVRWPEHEFT
jgi:hypothetical protein